MQASQTDTGSGNNKPQNETPEQAGRAQIHRDK